MKFSKLLLFITLFFSLIIMASCTIPSSSQDPFIVGTYDSYIEIDHPSISKAKIILKAIDQETYYNKNRKNVIEDYYANENNKYFSLDLYFYLLEKNDYVLINVQNISYSKDTPQTYHGEMLHWEDEQIISFTLVNEVRIENGKEEPQIRILFCDNEEYTFYLVLNSSKEDSKK